MSFPAKSIKALIFIFGVAANHSSAQSWTQLSDFPGTARDDGTVFVIGSKAYCLTGMEVGWQCTRDGSVFDCNAETWSAMQSLPVGQERQYATSWSFNNEGYLFGGINCSGTCLNDFWKYDASTNSWVQLGNFPGAGRYGMTTFILNNTQAYVLGGKLCDGTFLNEVWMYDLASGVWSQKNNIPVPVWRGAAFVIDTSAYFCLGMNSSTDFNHSLFTYLPASDSWIALPNLSLPDRRYVAAAICNGKACLYGGEDSLNTITNDLLVFDPSDSSIAIMSGIPAAGRKGGMTFSFNNTFYTTTGLDENQNRIKETWKFTGLVGTSEIMKGLSFSLYPNPANNYFAIDNISAEPLSCGSYEVKIYNSTGDLIFCRKIESFPFQVNCAAFASGIYSVVVSSDNKVLIRNRVALVK